MGCSKGGRKGKGGEDGREEGGEDRWEVGGEEDRAGGEDGGEHRGEEDRGQEGRAEETSCPSASPPAPGSGLGCFPMGSITRHIWCLLSLELRESLHCFSLLLVCAFENF